MKDEAAPGTRPVLSSFCLHPSSFDSMPKASKELVVSNSLGLHARPAMQFVDLANQFSSAVMVYKGGEEPAEADGKSVMQMIILAATQGTPIRIEAEGDDAEEAVVKLAELFESKFGEE
jgi:phosphotransferase system HPr (HPr) family protein